MRKMNLQFFAEPAVGGDPGPGAAPAGTAQQTLPGTGQQTNSDDALKKAFGL